MLSESDRVILALADGRIPDGIDPGSAKGRHYARVIQAVEADMAAAPPMSDAVKARVVALLRGGPDAA